MEMNEATIQLEAMVKEVEAPKKGETTDEAIEAISNQWENVLRRLAE